MPGTTRLCSTPWLRTDGTQRFSFPPAACWHMVMLPGKLVTIFGKSSCVSRMLGEKVIWRVEVLQILFTCWFWQGDQLQRVKFRFEDCNVSVPLHGVG